LVGCQADREKERKVSTEEAAQYAAEMDLLFMETSAKTGHNVNTLFLTIASKAVAAVALLRPVKSVTQFKRAAGKWFGKKQTQGGNNKPASFDGKGVLHGIGTNAGTRPYTNPHEMSAHGAGGLVASMSSVDPCGYGSTPGRFVMHNHDGNSLNSTDDTPNSWMSVALGQCRRLVPTHYCLRHGYHYGDNRLLHWRFEGSNDGASWIVLKDHTDDTSSFPDHGYSVAEWPVDPREALHAESHGFRRFRIIQTRKNSGSSDSLHCAGIELYGELTEYAT
jgi:hypothetical protein